MKPVHGDTVSNDSSSGTWCSYSNQSGLSFRRLSTLQGARTDRIYHDKYIPLKENNLLEKLVKTRVLYEELRHQILSSSLITPSNGNLISETQPLVVGKRLFKANKSKIIQLVDLVDKGVILRPEKLCECCVSSNYNSETRYEYGPKERRQRQIHTGGYLTSKSSIISKKKAVGESRLEIKFKTKNIKSDPCTSKVKEFMKQKSREALKRNPEVQAFNIDGIIYKKSHHKLKRSNPHLIDGVRLSVSKIKQRQQPIKDIKKSKSIAKKSLETIINHRHFLKVKPCCRINVAENASGTNSPNRIIEKEISHQTVQDSEPKFDMKVQYQNCYVENWNYKFECPTETPVRHSSRDKHRMTDSFLHCLPRTSDGKRQAAKNINKEIYTNKSFKINTLANHTDKSKVLKQNENLSALELSQIGKSKETSILVPQGQNSTHLQTKISTLLASSKKSIPLLSIDSIPRVDSLISKTNCKAFKNSIKFRCGPVKFKKSCANKNENSYKATNMPSSEICTDFQINVADPNCSVLEKRCLDRRQYSNFSLGTCRKSSNISSDLSSNLIKSQQNKISPCGNNSIVDTFNFTKHHKEKCKCDGKLHEHKQKRISKSVKNGSHALKRCLCTFKLKAMNINNEQKTSYINDIESIQSQTFTKTKKLSCELFVCASGEYVSTKCDSWKIQYHSKLTSKSLTALEQYGTITNLLQVKTSYFNNCRVLHNHKNLIEGSRLVQYKKSETGSLGKTKYQFKKHCSKCLCSFNELNTENNMKIPKKLSKATIVSLDHIVIHPKTISKISELVIDTMPSIIQRIPSCNIAKKNKKNAVTGTVMIKDNEGPFIPSVEHRKTKSGSFRSQRSYQLPKTKRVQSSIETYKHRCLINNNEVNINRFIDQSSLQEIIDSNSYCGITNDILKDTCLSTYNISHESNEYFYKVHPNALKCSLKDSVLPGNFKLIKIQKETYLMIKPSKKAGCSALKLRNSNYITSTTAHKHKYFDRNISNENKNCVEKNKTKGTATELLIKPRYIQLYTDGNQKSDMKTYLERSKYQNTEPAMEGTQNYYCDPTTVYKSAKNGIKYKADSETVHKYKNIVLKDNLNKEKKSHTRRHFGGESSSIISVSSSIAIKSKTLHPYFQSKFKIFEPESMNQCRTFEINSKLSCDGMNSGIKNVKAQSRERSLDIETCELSQLNSSNAFIYSSQFLKPVNPHLTGVSSLLRRCFCTMNLQVGDGKGSSKFRYKLKPYECAPYDCVPYECDPYECQKRIMKRLIRKSSSTDTEEIKSSSNKIARAKKHQSVSMSEPKSKSHRRAVCDCRSTFSPNVKNYKLIKNEGVRGNNIYSHNAHDTQSSIRKIRNKSSVTPILKRCFCTVKLHKNKESNKTLDVNTVSSSTHLTKTDKLMIRSSERGPNARLNKNGGLKTQGLVIDKCICPELITTRKKIAKDMRATDPRALSSSSLQVSSHTKRRHKYVGSKNISDQPARSREREQVRDIKSKHMSVNRLSTPSARQAVKVGSSFSFSLEFYKDREIISVDQTEKTLSKEYRQNTFQSPKFSSRNVRKKRSLVNSRSVVNTGSQASPVTQEPSTMTGSFLKRCFCKTKKRSQKKIYKNTSIGTQESICPCRRSLSRNVCECIKFINYRQSVDQASETEKYRMQLINKRYSVDKASGTDKHLRGYVSKECECVQVITKKHHRNIGTEKPVTKSVSSSVTSSKTSKARILHPIQHKTHSSKIRQIKPTLLPGTIGNEETLGGSLHRQSVRIGSNFSFDIEFHKDSQFPGDEKVQAAAEAIKETRNKMSDDVRHMAATKNKRRVESSQYSLISDINTPKATKAVGPILRKCLCNLKLQDEKHSNQNNQSNSIHRGTVTPFVRPVPNFHNRGVMTVYKLKTYPYKLAPHECEPGVCIPGECDPYECLRRMNRRHRGSSTDGYSTKSALSMTKPARKYKDNRVQFCNKEKCPRTKEGHTRPRPVPRPRQGIEVRQKPRTIKAANRQAVKIGSNFSFNVEFYKDRMQGGGTGGPKPCPQPCPKPCPEVCPKTCPKRFMNSGTDAAGISYRNKKAQRKRGQMHNRDSQVFGRKMRSTMTGVGPFLKRCFCTLQLQRRNDKALPHRGEKREKKRKKDEKHSDSSSIYTETARYRPEPLYREQGTGPRKKHKKHERKLEPYECEPGVCVPGQCDPYVCLERIKRRGMHSKYAGTGGRHKMHSVSSSVTDPGYRRHRNRSVSSSMMDRRPSRVQKTQKHNKLRKIERPIRPIVKERSPRPSSPNSQRQAVRIGSSFSFNIEFYKDRNELAPVQARPEPARAAAAPVKYIKRPVPVKGIRTDSTGSGPIPTRTRSMSSSNKNNLRNRRLQAHSKTLLKRCFCTLKLQKIGTRQRQTQGSIASIGTYYKTAGAQIRKKNEIVPQYREFGTRTKRRQLDPYECEPGVCVPGQCDPYECLERIKRRNLLVHSGTGMCYPCTRSMSNLTPQYYRSRSMNTHVNRPPRTKHHRGHTETPRRIKQPPPRPSRALENIHNRQAVRLGSSFSFNVEFFKDRSGVTKEAPCRPSICKKPTCSPLKCKTSSCSVTCPTKANQRCRNMQCQGGGHDRMLQAKGARTESRGSGVPLLKRCFCTLTLQRAEVNSYMIPLRARLYSEKSTCTKNKYFSSESEQQADLMSDYCEPDMYRSECDPDYSVVSFIKRGLRRKSRTAGSHMVRSRDISRGELGSRFTAFDSQPSSWYNRKQCGRVETIVEEPRFKFFNRPNTKQTVRISSNCNFNIEFFKDIIFPEPCEVEEEFDEMSAVTEAIYPRHEKKRFRKDHFEPHDVDRPFYAERYRPKYKHKKIREPISEGDKLFSIEHYRPKLHLQKTLTGKVQDEANKSIKTLKDNTHPPCKKCKTDKEPDEHSKKIKIDKEPDEHSKKNIKAEKKPYPPCKKSIADKEPDEHSKKSKLEKGVDEDTKIKKKSDRPINKIFKSLCISKGNKCICHSDKNNKCLCSTNEKNGDNSANGNKPANGNKSTNANKSTKGNKKYKCLCPPNEPNGKKLSNLSKKVKGTQPENMFVNKAITVARMEMGIHKHKSKLSTTKKSQLHGAKAALRKTNEIVNDVFCRNALNLQKCKPEHGDSKATTICEVSISRSEPCTFNTTFQSTTPVVLTKEKFSTNLLSSKSEKVSRVITHQERSFLTLTSSEIQSELNNNYYFPIATVSVSRSRQRNKLEMKLCSAEWLKTKSLCNHSFKADMLSEIETKLHKQKQANLEKRQREFSSQLLKSPELLSYKMIASGNVKQIKNKVSSSELLLTFFCSSKLRKTKSEDISRNACKSTTLIKSRCSTCHLSCKDLQEICFFKTQVAKTKTGKCRSVARIDKMPLSIFTPKEYWVQYQIQHSKLRKCLDNQTAMHGQFTHNQSQYAKLETIMPYSPYRFRKIKSKMLFRHESKTYSNNCCSFCRSFCKLPIKRLSDVANRCYSACQYHTGFCINCDHLSQDCLDEIIKTSKTFMIIKNECNIGTIKIQPWDPSRTNVKTLICCFLRALSSTKRIRHHSFVFKTSKQCIHFTPARLSFKMYRRSNDKCTFKTSFRKKYTTYNKYQRHTPNNYKIGYLANSRRTAIKLFKKPQVYCETQRKLTFQHNHILPPVLSSKSNTDLSNSRVNEMEIFLVQSGSCNVLTTKVNKNIHLGKDTKMPSQTLVLSSSSFSSPGRRFDFQNRRDIRKSTANPFKQQRKLSCRSVKLVKATSNLKNLTACSNFNNNGINSREPFVKAYYKKGLLPTKLNEHVFFQKLSKDRKKSCPCYFCKKKCISKFPKSRTKVKSKYAIECRMKPVKEIQKHCSGNIAIKNRSLSNTQACVNNKHIITTFDAVDEDIKKVFGNVKPESLKDIKDDNAKSQQVLKNYYYHLWMTNLLMCIHENGLSNPKNTVGTDYGNIFDPKRTYRHFKCILLNLRAAFVALCSFSHYPEIASKRTAFKHMRTNFARVIKDNLSKPASMCIHSFKHIRKIHKRMLPKCLRSPKNTADLGSSTLYLACPQIKPPFSIYWLWPRFYPHFITLIRVWRQLIDVLLFVLWSPCLLSAQLCKAFLCCFIRLRLHCYLK